MKKLTALTLLAGLMNFCKAQSTFTSANYALAGDTFYLTKAQPVNLNFDTTGANISWDYSSLTGISQRRLIFRAPNQTGYTALQFPYIYNTNNVNLSSTDGQTTAILGFQQTNMNDYYLKNTSYLREKANAYTLVYNGLALNIKNVYSNPDTLYSFPLSYNGINSSHASYTVTVPPDLFYQYERIVRQDTVKGWGTLITPYGTFANCLKLVSNMTKIDSIAFNGNAVVAHDTSYTREYKWFDPSKKYPLLIVRQEKLNNVYVTSSIEYLDVQQYYQPKALFAYVPVLPNMGDTISFQNLSTNALSYSWDFGDPSSGASNQSNEINPQHTYQLPGKYVVKLLAYNGPLTDTASMLVNISPVNFTYRFTGNGNWSDSLNWENQLVPPSTLPSGNYIVIDPSGTCTLNMTQYIATGASLTVNPSKSFIIPGNLRLLNN